MENLRLTQAMNFVTETIQDTLIVLAKKGITDAETIYATCKYLSAQLQLPFDLVLDIMTALAK